MNGSSESRADSTVHAYSVLVLLSLIHVIYALDRTIASIVAEQVKAAFTLSDSQVGMFLGLSYGIAFALSSLVSGPLIDRRNRVHLLAAAVFVWSFATALCGIAPSFLFLLFFRLLVGAAEAWGSPASFSILSDHFPASRRGMAIGVFKIGSPVGILLASVLGGYVATHYGWREAFFVAGIPGCLLALVLWWTVRDPQRGRLDEGYDPGAIGFSLTEVAQHVWRVPGLFALVAGTVVVVFACAGVSMFIVPFFQRVHGMSLMEASGAFALATSIGALSPFLLGSLNDWMTRRGLHRGIWFSVIATGAILASGSVMLLADERWLAVGAMLVWQALAVGITAPNYASVLSLTPASARGTVVALLMLGVNLIGVGLAPSLFGALSDLLGGGTALRQALFIDLLFCLIAMACFVRAAAAVRTAAQAQARRA
jgi:MFS family permease